jgi:hypothetical protein
MLLTLLLIPHGFRLVVALPYRPCSYCWQLYRNGLPVGRARWTSGVQNAVCFDLKHPILPGVYQVQVQVVTEG